MDAFLDNQERRQVQRMYERWNQFANADVLIPIMFTRGIISMREREELDIKPTSFAKNEYLFDSYLMRSTYDQICVIRTILNDPNGPSAHRELAAQLPYREPKPPSPPPPTPAPKPTPTNSNTAAPDSNQAPPHGTQREHEPMDDDNHVGVEERTRAPYDATPNLVEDFRNLSSNSHSSQPDTNTSHGSSSPSQTNQPPSSSQSNAQHPQDSNAPNNAPPNHEPFMSNRYDIKTKAYQETMPRKENSQDKKNPPTNPIPDPKTVHKHRPGIPDDTNAPRLSYYPVKTDTTTHEASPHGKGLCVIFANFTSDLEGYIRDTQDITEFFQTKLTYTTMGAQGGRDEKHYRNLTAEAFKQKLTEVQDYINNQNNGIDRLFMFIMSHGDEFGVKMRPPDFQDSTTRDRIKAEAITDMFAHNQVPSLKGLPKCFFMQVCRGEEIARAANTPAASPDRSDMDTGEGDILPDQKIEQPRIVAIGADTLICHAAKEGKYSWVIDPRDGKRGGSWFIQETMDVFKRYYLHEHVLDMMTEVNDRVSKKIGLTRVTLHGDTRRTQQYAYQLPQVVNNLTKKLYL